MPFKVRFCALLASAGGVGKCPVAPGTAGSMVGLGLYLLLPKHLMIQLSVLSIVIICGVWSANVVAWYERDHDPSHVVIDEVAGMLLACFLLPKTWLALCSAFVLFRILDIGKWFPMRQLEQLPGGWGIMMDDVAAGLLTRLLLIWL